MTSEMYNLLTFAVIFLLLASSLFLAAMILFARAINLVWTANRRLVEAKKHWLAGQRAMWQAESDLAAGLNRLVKAVRADG